MTNINLYSTICTNQNKTQQIMIYNYEIELISKRLFKNHNVCETKKLNRQNVQENKLYNIVANYKFLRKNKINSNLFPKYK